MRMDRLAIFPGVFSISAAISALILCGSCSADTSSEAPAKAKPREFLFGADFDPKLPETTKALFYETGMNCIRLTGGGYSWSVPMHKKQAEDFDARGLKVYLQLGSHYPCADYFKLKGSWLVDSEGKTGEEDRKAWAISYGPDNKWPQYSYSSEETRAMFVKDFSSYLGNFPPNTNVSGVILHNEAGYFWNDKRLFDYNPATVEKFRAWLQAKHGTIAELNRRWGSSFASFQAVTPPPKPPVQKQIGPWMDWRRFQVQLIAEFLKWENGFLKSVRPDIPTTTNLDGPMTHWYGYRCSDNYEYSAMMDRPGIDIYPTQWTDRDFVPYAMDHLQGVAQGRDPQILECDSFSSKLWKYSEAQRGGLLRGELWSMIGHGAGAILIWGFSRNDDFSLTDGEFNDRVLACRDIAHQANMIGIGSFFRAPSKVAVCIDPDSYIYATGNEARPNSESPALDSENHGFHAAILSSGVQSDVIQTQQLRVMDLSKYKALALPAATMMDEALAAKLKAFVANGGLLVADGAFASMDRWGVRLPSAPSYGFDKVFGAQPGAIAPSGKGFALLLPEKSGGSYMGGPATGSLRDSMKAALASVSVKPGVELSPDSASGLDSSVLRDSSGNALLVLCSHGSKGKLPPLVQDVSAKLSEGSFKKAFLLAPTSSNGSVVFSGARPLELSAVEGGFSVKVGDVSFAAPVLFAKDMGPLLSAEAPAVAKAGSELEFKIVCHNPSPRAFSGSVSLRLPPGLSGPIEASKLEIEPYSSGTASFKVSVMKGAKPGRAALGAFLSSASIPEGLSSVPVDITIE